MGNSPHTAPEKLALLGITCTVLKYDIEASYYQWIYETIHQEDLEQFNITVPGTKKQDFYIE